MRRSDHHRSDGVNEVGDEHTFTVHVTQSSTVAPVTDVEGVIPEVTLTASSGAVVDLIEDTCATTGTDADGCSGECTVTFNSDSAGVITGHAS